LEKAFVRVARGYSDRHGVSFSAWRQIGVDVDVLAAAGIKPTAKPRPNGAEPVAAKEEAIVEKAPQPIKKVAAKKAAAAPAKKATAAAKKNGTAKTVKKKAAAPQAEQPNLLS
jgi:hypothetical protein